MDLINRIMNRRKKTPLIIIKEETELMFLEKQLEAITSIYKKKYKELIKKHNEESDKVWDKISEVLVSKKLIKNNEIEIEIENGVVYTLDGANNE